MGDLPVPPFVETLFEWEMALEIVKLIVSVSVLIFFAVVIGGIAWLAARQNHKLSHSNNPFSLL